MEKTIELLHGYKDKTGAVHRTVTFSKRLKISDHISIGSDPRSESPTLFEALVLKRMITKFGTLLMPISEMVLIALDEFDADDLRNAAGEFLALSKGDASGEIISDNTVRLPFGFPNEGGEPYKRVVFGNLTTGQDRVEADSKNLDGIARSIFLLGREIVRIETEDGVSLDGPVPIESFKDLDAADLEFLRTGALRWKRSFRNEREKLSRVRDGERGSTANAGNEAV